MKSPQWMNQKFSRCKCQRVANVNKWAVFDRCLQDVYNVVYSDFPLFFLDFLMFLGSCKYVNILTTFKIKKTHFSVKLIYRKVVYIYRRLHRFFLVFPTFLAVNVFCRSYLQRYLQPYLENFCLLPLLQLEGIGYLSRLWDSNNGIRMI